ncbi:MAG: ATP-binding cassette domain-containing protein, partial [Planctomycetales bacterium]|nr:ATP-binding cassette domain-containing protein [Planctomycetales bacterium]
HHGAKSEFNFVRIIGPQLVASPALLNVDHFTRRINGRVLLDSVTFDVSAGDRIGLVGPTGSGKSLLLRSIAMLEPIDSGSLLWKSSPIRNDQVTNYRSNVIYLHQRAARFEGTVESVLQLPFTLAANRDRSFDRQWIIRQLASVDRDASFLEQTHDQLSGGETQIVALLRAIQLAPTVLLLDEPTSALDSLAAAHVESIVMRWFDDSPALRAYVWVSHDPSQSERVCRTVTRMRAGRIETTEDHP